MTAPLRLAFMGAPAFAVPTLAALLQAGHRVVRVYSQPPRPAGRGQRETPTPVAAFAAGHGLPVATPVSLKEPAEQAAFAALALDAAVVVAYGLILPPAILQAPRLGCLNVHASLLPRWRGAAPIQRAILAGDAVTGVCVMQMDAGLDTGPVWLRRETRIEAGDTAGTLHDRLAQLGAEALVAALPTIVGGEASPTPQPDDGATYARKLEKHEAWLDWSRATAELERQVRAFNPWPVAQTKLPDATVLRVWMTSASLPQARDEPGTIVAIGNGTITVATGDGALELAEVQLPGRNRLSAGEFARQRPDLVGQKLGD